jgi:exonuclease VII large subunit
MCAGEGDFVSAVGVVRPEVSDKTRQQLNFRVSASELQITDAPDAAASRRRERSVLARLRELVPERKSLPFKSQLTVAVICGSGSQVFDDFLRGLGNYRSHMSVERVTANMLDPTSVSEAISGIHTDIVAVIRGGGSKDQFAVFDDINVIEGLARKTDAYRVLAIGHSQDAAIAGFVVEYVAAVPFDAGVHVAKQLDRSRQVRESEVAHSALRGREIELQGELKRAKEIQFRTAIISAVVGFLLALVLVTVRG